MVEPAGYEIMVKILTIAALWLTLRTANEKPLTYMEVFTCIVMGTVAGNGFVYMYEHPSFNEIWALIDIRALMRAIMVAATILVPVLIILSWTSWLWKKFHRKKQPM